MHGAALAIISACVPEPASMLHRTLALALLFAPTIAEAQLCEGQSAAIAPDGRAFGHLPYGDAPETELVTLPSEYSVGNPCVVRADMLPDLLRLFAAAQGDPAVMGQLRALSCHRSIARQRGVFCRGETSNPADRAISVAPPGYSEHSTGYALDFAVRPANGCPDAEACMAATPAARWLRTNAPRFGFEQSFPGGNKQHVKWEPWHWRWVGATSSTLGAAKARFVFSRARTQYPADPGIVALVLKVATQPPVPAQDLPKVVSGKKKRR
jgi:D-alanyl-D-alanine carboxypeptidase